MFKKQKSCQANTGPIGKAHSASGENVTTVSVVIPCHNAASTILDTLMSVVNASAKQALDIVVVDDSSTDETAKKARSFAKKLPSPHSLRIARRLRNRGAGAARNLGLTKAQGEFVMFLDADDLLDRGAIDELVDRVEGTDADFVLFRYRYVRERSLEASSSMLPEDTRIWNDALAASRSGKLAPASFPKIVRLTNYPWNKLIRMNFAKRARLRFSETPVNNDIAAHWCLFTNARTVILHDKALISHYVIQGNLQITNVFDSRRLSVFTAIAEAEQHVYKSAETLSIFYFHLMQFKLSLIKWAFRRMPHSLHAAYRCKVKETYARFSREDYIYLALKAKSSADEMLDLKIAPERVLR